MNADAPGEALARLAPQQEVPSASWLVLAPGARLVATDSHTTRETTFLGPARVRACVDGREESWVAAGSFESVAGAGEAPGAEEWVVTPLGVIRYGAAQVRIDVLARDGKVKITLVSGAAFLSLADDAHVQQGAGAPDAWDAGWKAEPRPGTPASSSQPKNLSEGWQRLEGVLTIAPARTRRPLDAARATLAQCAGLSKRARDLASAMLSRDASYAPATAAEQVTTRRLARASCAVAALRVRMTPASDGRSAMLAQISEADVSRSALPAAPANP
jgi:hypothetical protein